MNLLHAEAGLEDEYDEELIRVALMYLAEGAKDEVRELKQDPVQRQAVLTMYRKTKAAARAAAAGAHGQVW